MCSQKIKQMITLLLNLIKQINSCRRRNAVFKSLAFPFF
jgi:hypothetical protein